MVGDLREFIEEARRFGELKTIGGAHWDLEIGRIAELSLSRPESPLLLFDDIPGYPRGYRVATNPFTSSRRVALALGLPPELTGLELIRAWKNKLAGVRPIPPVFVADAPVLENVLTGDAVDVLKFPTPKWHQHDGGRYIGTGCMVIQKDPDNGWVNVGTYRSQVVDRNTVTLHTVPGHHGAIIQRKYWERGLACPTAMVCGQGPQLWVSAMSPVPLGVGELDWTGGVRDKAVEVVRGRTVDLPIPAEAEMVLEGEVPPPAAASAEEGPFGEWEGYYAGHRSPHPVLRVSAVLHRNDPIQFGVPMLVGTHDDNMVQTMDYSAQLWAGMEKQIPGVMGVSFVGQARRKPMIVVSLKQMYPGHVKQAALIASSIYGGGTHIGRFIVIVDDDIDPSNISEVLWALGTRCDPASQIDLVGGRTSQASDARIDPAARRAGDFTCSTALIDACRPWAWRDRFPKATKSSHETLAEVRQKWGKLLFD